MEFSIIRVKIGTKGIFYRTIDYLSIGGWKMKNIIDCY